MGGMTALAYCLLYPSVSESMVAISSSLRALPFAIALRSLQREIVRTDPTWNGGEYEAGAGPVSGMRLARKVGMITYRSAQEWEQRFGRDPASEEWQSDEPFGINFAIESYLQAHANKFTGGFDPNCYLYLSRAMDYFDVNDLSSIALRRALIVGVVTDILFPMHQQKELADGLKEFVDDIEYVNLESINGHDSFLVDMDSFQPVIRRFYGTE